MLFTKQDKRSDFERKVDDHLLRLMGEAKTAEDIERIVDIMKSKQEVLSIKQPVVKLDTMMICAVGLVQTIMILRHEEFNVIASKALGFIVKGRA